MWAEFMALMPEILLALAAFTIFCLRSYLADRNLETRAVWLSALGLGGLGLWIFFYGEGNRPLAAGLLIEDAFSRITHSLVLLASAVALAIGVEAGPRALARDPYVTALVVLAVLGLLLVAGANDVLALFVGLQIYTLSVHSLMAQRAGSGKAGAAALLTALSGVLGSALVLFGVALVVAATGSTGYADLADTLANPPGTLAATGMALLIAGLAFSLALAPFHLWLAPALEATPWPVVALMVGAAPFALMSASARLLFVAFGELIDLWQPVLAALGLVSVAAGAIAGLVTDRLSHLLAAFVTIGAGFGAMALSAGTVAGVAAMLAFMTLQGTAMLGLVAFAALLDKDGRAVENMRDFDGYATTEMSRGFAVLLILLSAAALPPLAGFVVRLSILQAMHDSGLIWQSLAGVGAMVLAAFAFLRPAWRLYVTAEPADVQTRAARLPDAIVTGSAALAVLSLLSLGGMEAVIEAAATRLER